jgi:hypothetical protein
MSHSPLPWSKGSKHEAWSTEITDRDGRTIAKVWTHGTNLPNKPDEKGLANLDLLVTAANHHAALVSALDSLLQKTRSETEYAGAMYHICRYCGVHDDRPCDSDCPTEIGESLLKEINQDRGHQPAPIVFQRSQPDESEALKLLAWCIAQFDGTSGAGVNHWIQSPEYRRARELIGQEAPFDEDDEEADGPASPSATDLQRVLHTLESIAETIEGTYEHDEDGDRVDDGDCHDLSAADVVERMMNEEADVDEAINIVARMIRDEQPVSIPNKLPEISHDELKCTCGCEEFRYVEEIYNWRTVKSLDNGVLLVGVRYETGEGYDDGHNPVLECRECLAQYNIPKDVEVEFD